MDRFRAAFREAIDRCESLRTTVAPGPDGTPERRLREVDFTLPVIDLSPKADPGAALGEFVSGRCRQLFDLAAPLFDSALVRLGDDDHVWYLNQHHIVTDAWSAATVFRLVERCYRSLGEGGELPVAPSFEEYAAFERRSREDSNQKASAHWRALAERAEPPAPLYGRPNRDGTTASVRRSLELGRDRSDALRALAKEDGVRSFTEGLSLFNLFATTTFALLHRVAGGRRLSLGTPLHNRSTPAFKETPGLFIELFPFSVAPEADATFADLLERVQRAFQAFLVHARPGSSAPAAGRSYNVVLNYITAGFPPFDGLDTEAAWWHPGHCESNQHLRVTVHDFNDTGALTVLFDFNRAVFPDRTWPWVIRHFEALLDALIEDRTQAIRDIDITHAEERALMLAPDRPPANLPPGRSLVEAFDRAARSHPDRPAVSGAGLTLTYGELRDRSRALAGRLAGAGVARGDVVGLLAERTVHTVAGILAILRAGGAYLPIATDNPAERTAFMQSDARARVLIAAREVPGWDGDRVDPTGEHPPSEQPDDALPDADDLAYLLYTSGSTGRPKGVRIEHRNVLNLVGGLRERVYADLPPHQRVALLAPFSFDASVQQVFAALLLGHELCLVPDAVRKDGAALLAFFQDERIDVSDGTPAHLALLARGTPEGPRDVRVRHLLIGGQALQPSTLRDFYQRFPSGDPVVTNVYGPTECCVDSTSHRISRAALKDLGERTPIGRPMPGESVYVMSGSALQPMGAPGELWIAGAGVGRGYQGHAERSDGAFIEDPFVAGRRCYRTGDVARVADDGHLDFLDRLDDQLKVRGYRIEPGEIEAALRTVSIPAEEPLRTGPKIDSVRRCTRCVLSEHYPGTTFDAEGVCNRCRDFERHAEAAARYFRPFSELEALLDEARAARTGEYDCLLLYSGGKDSSYVLHRLVEMGLKVLAYTFDNGFISPAAFENIERQTRALGVESIVSRTSRMDAIFVESLREDNTVCTGCFKALTTISTRLAADRGIPMVLTGLSRGQIFETKLEGLLNAGITAVEDIEAQLMNFRHIYHAQKDRTADLLGVSVQDVELDRFHFLDFFRYDPTPVAEVKDYLGARDSFWTAPKDTGFCSSNCMMNDIGICVHSRERGYHNYEAPLSWDIRLGIAGREDALAEVESPIDVDRVNHVLRKIGYLSKRIEDAVVAKRRGATGEGDALCAWYTASRELDPKEIRDALAERLPPWMIPQHFVPVPAIPLTDNGKIDYAALPDPGAGPEPEAGADTPPEGLVEEHIAMIWAEQLEVPVPSATKSFFEYGGASLQAMDVMLRLCRDFGVELPLQELFGAPTVRALAARVESAIEAELEEAGELGDPETGVGASAG